MEYLTDIICSVGVWICVFTDKSLVAVPELPSTTVSCRRRKDRPGEAWEIDWRDAGGRLKVRLNFEGRTLKETAEQRLQEVVESHERRRHHERT